MDQSFVDYLTQELKVRKLRNSKYSMRAFANALEVNIGVISGILNGKRKISSKYIEGFGMKLGLSVEDIGKYQHVLDIKNAFKEDKIFEKYTQVTLDSYQLISEWQHIAMIYLRDKNNCLLAINDLAEQLDIPKKKVSESLQRLLRLDIIQKTNKGYLVISNAFLTNLDSDLGRTAGRKFIRDIMHKSLEALEEVDINDRDHSTITMSFSPKEMDNAKSMIKKFRRKFLSSFDKTSDDNKVYSLQLSFFPLSKDK